MHSYCIYEGIDYRIKKIKHRKKSGDVEKYCRAYFTPYMGAHNNDPNKPRKNGQKEATVTINKVTVSFLSVERTDPALGEGGLFFTVEMIIAYETVRMRMIKTE